MRLVIDANILFAALIKDSLTAELIINDELQLYAPEFLLDEFAKYEKIILKKTHRTSDDFKKFLELFKRRIKIIPQEDIMLFIEQGTEISPDPKDVVYLALALTINAKVWSNDKKLKEQQNQIEILTTEEILSRIKSIK